MDKLIGEIYVYCTDFILNLANIFNLSYYEINAIIFCFLYPLLLVGFIAIYLFQKRRLNNLMRNWKEEDFIINYEKNILLTLGIINRSIYRLQFFWIICRQ